MSECLDTQNTSVLQLNPTFLANTPEKPSQQHPSHRAKAKKIKVSKQKLAASVAAASITTEGLSPAEAPHRDETSKMAGKKGFYSLPRQVYDLRVSILPKNKHAMMSSVQIVPKTALKEPKT